jgi:hypothetical protein
MGSTEYARLRVTQAYRMVLDREPDAAGLNYWTAKVTSGAIPVDNIALSLYQSAEFYSRSGGTDAGFVAALYRKMLGREADAAGVSYWTARIRPLGSASVIRNIWMSNEAVRMRVSGYYPTYLGRAVDAAGLAYWSSVLTSRGEAQVRLGLTGSAEYANRAVLRFP